MSECVRCSKCGQHWPETEVPRVTVDAGCVGEEVIEGCDACGTDAHLMDVSAAEVQA